MTHVKELFDLTGKVAVVTGGGHGLGYFAAEGLAEAGADLVICGRDRAKLDRAASTIVESSGRACVAFSCDVTSESGVVALREQVVERFGRCDILINNAGIGGMGPTHEFSLQQWENIMDVNLKGMFLVSREIGKIMLAQKSGSIINFSSENGQVGFSFGMTAYATSKIGAIGMSRSLAAEWGPYGVRVNALLPGNMEEGMMADLKNSDSDIYKLAGDAFLHMTPLKSFGNGNDIKAAVVYLGSEAGRYVNGAQLVLDGGFTISSGL